MLFVLGQEYAPDSKYKYCSYPLNPCIRFSFLIFIEAEALVYATDWVVLPVIVSMSSNCLSYNSINSNLYLKLFNSSVALPKWTKFSKCEGVTVKKSNDAVSTGLIYP